MISPLRDLNRFLFTPQTSRALGVYRILLGLLIFYSSVIFLKDSNSFFTDQGVISVATLEAFSPSPNTGFAYLLTSPVEAYGLFFMLFFTTGLFIVGYKTRLSAAACYVLLLSLQQRNPYVFSGADLLLKCMLFLFIFSPKDQFFSLDRRKAKILNDHQWPVAQRAMQIQLCIIYFTNSLMKVHGNLWYQGRAMDAVLGLVDFNVPGIEVLRNFPALCVGLTYATMLTEIALPFLLWFRPTRNYAAIAGLMLHGWITIFMRIPYFGPGMIAPYILFFREDEVDRAILWIRSRVGGKILALKRGVHN